jgi:hypothetical protein
MRFGPRVRLPLGLHGALLPVLDSGGMALAHVFDALPFNYEWNPTSQLAMVTSQVVHWDFSNAARSGLAEMRS